MLDLNDILGTLPSGAIARLSDDELTKYLRENYIDNDAERARRKKMRMRVDLYHDRGEAQINAMLDKVFKNELVRSLRKQFVEIASFQNLTKRIIREISSVYSEPATRRVASNAMNMRYKELQNDIRMDRRLRLANQMLNLCNEVVVWFDVSMGKPVLRIVTPDNFHAIAHPLDPTMLVGLIFDRPMGGYIVVSDSDIMHLDKAGRMLSGGRKSHGLSRMPMVMAHRAEPTESLLNSHTGSDIINAHQALALINTMMLKHQKSGTKQAVATGDVSDMALSQPMEGEHLLQAPEGVTFSTLDLGANPDNYIKAARSVIKQISANYGIPESVFDMSYQATSGYEIELKRTGLKEVRRDQIMDWIPVERDLASIMAEVLTESKSERAFNTFGWSLAFGEVETPQEPMAKLVYWEKKRSMGLMNTEDMLLELNRDMTPKEAEEQIALNAIVESRRVDLYRKLNVSPNTPLGGQSTDLLQSDLTTGNGN